MGRAASSGCSGHRAGSVDSCNSISSDSLPPLESITSDEAVEDDCLSITSTSLDNDQLISDAFMSSVFLSPHLPDCFSTYREGEHSVTVDEFQLTYGWSAPSRPVDLHFVRWSGALLMDVAATIDHFGQSTVRYAAQSADSYAESSDVNRTQRWMQSLTQNLPLDDPFRHVVLWYTSRHIPLPCYLFKFLAIAFQHERTTGLPSTCRPLPPGGTLVVNLFHRTDPDPMQWICPLATDPTLGPSTYLALTRNLHLAFAQALKAGTIPRYITNSIPLELSMPLPVPAELDHPLLPYTRVKGRITHAQRRLITGIRQEVEQLDLTGLACHRKFCEEYDKRASYYSHASKDIPHFHCCCYSPDATQRVDGNPYCHQFEIDYIKAICDVFDLLDCVDEVGMKRVTVISMLCEMITSTLEPFHEDIRCAFNNFYTAYPYYDSTYVFSLDAAL
ncbi:hypothetical protein V5O48_018666 [Marasmius crinis-equi]|uniref:Uncharacterized protein n=1 Tax=Marasmius crinis-equi TaxID=585013 RepID=A0ABR3EKM9_9AGAR